MTEPTTPTPPQPPPITWGWWEPKRRAQWPKAAGNAKNFTLTPEEIKAYSEMLTSMHELLTKEANAARYTLACLQSGRVGMNNEPPRLHTLGSILEFVVNEAKHRLRLQRFLLDVTTRAKNENSGSATQSDGQPAPNVASGSGDQQPEGAAGAVPQENGGGATPPV